MTAQGGLLLRGMRWRLGASLLTVLTATIAVATAVLGPMYLHTAGDSVLRRSVASASIQAKGATLLAYAGSHPVTLAAIQRAEREVAAAAGAPQLYGVPITTVESGAQLDAPGNQFPLHSELLARPGICHALHFIHGSCQLGPGDVVMSERGARQLHLGLGATVSPGFSGRTTPLHLRITGIFAAPDLSLPYWWGNGAGYFPLEEKSRSGASKATDALVSSRATALAVPPQAVPTVTGQLPLRAGSVTLADESAVRAAFQHTTGTLRAQLIRLSSGLPAIFAGSDHQRHVMATIIAVAATQLVLLAVWVLGSLLVRSSDARRSEARIARLRGFSPASMLWVTAAEPAVLCLLGAALGVGAAYAAVVLARARLFVGGSAIVFDRWTFAALVLTLLAIVGALGIGTARLLRSADLAAGPTRSARGTSTWSLVTDAVLVVLAVVALVALSTTGALGGRTDPLASAAPGLIALGAAVIAVHLILFVCRLGVRLSADSDRVAPFLALRQTVRRPMVLRQARVLIIALCLACFATVAWSVARSNRATAAEFQIGSRAVVSVAPTSPQRLQAAVDRVDPHRRFAMAAVDLQTPSTALLAVDASRLTAVASWPRGLSARNLASVARTIAPPSAPTVQLPDAPVTVSAQVSATGAVAAQLGDVELSLWAFTSRGGTGIVDLGRLRPGAHLYRGSLAGVCDGGCRLAGLGLLPAPGSTVSSGGSVSVRVGRVTAGAAAVTADLSAGDWRSGADGVQITTAPGSGLSATVTGAAIGADGGASGTSTAPMLTPADSPQTLPAVATGRLQALNSGAVGALSTQGFDGNTVSFRPTVSASALPRVGADAAMVNLRFLANLQVEPARPGARDEVWLGPHAPADAVARLRDAGLHPTGVQRSATVFNALQRSAPALADDFLLLATIAALLVAAASTLGALGATTRERATELASLEVAGVPRPVLIRSLGLESVILLITALCGAGAGALAAVLAVPSLPELAASTLAPLHYGLPAGVLAAVTATVIIAVALAAAAITAILLRRMSPTLLRTAPDDVSG